MTESDLKQGKDSSALVGRLLIMAVAMFGFGFLLVPVYNAFCEVTGLGGKTNRVAATSADTIADTSREITLEFVTVVNAYAPWDFDSKVKKMTVHPGGMYEAYFVASNLTNNVKIAQAVPSVTPQQAAKYFKKLDCFCFTTQEFAAQEQKEMAVRFVIDSDLPDYIDTVTLSYTFFDATRLSQNPAEPNEAHLSKQ